MSLRCTDPATEFALTYEEHHRAVYAVVCRLCGPEYGDEVTQEVFLRLWLRPERFETSRGSMRSFLLTIAHNVAVDMLRSDNARRAREDKDERGRVAHQEDTPDAALRRDLRETVLAALDALPSEQREALITAFYGDCTYRDAAVVLGVPEGTIKSRIRRALETLHHDLQEAGLNELRATSGRSPTEMWALVQRDCAASMSV